MAAVTLSASIASFLFSCSRSRSFTPMAARPAARTDLVSMRMVLPNCLMHLISVVSSTRLMLATLPTDPALGCLWPAVAGDF